MNKKYGAIKGDFHMDVYSHGQAWSKRVLWAYVVHNKSTGEEIYRLEGLATRVQACRLGHGRIWRLDDVARKIAKAEPEAAAEG